MLNRRSIEMQIVSLFFFPVELLCIKFTNAGKYLATKGTDLGNYVSSGDSSNRSDILSRLSQNTIFNGVSLASLSLLFS